MEDDQTSDTQAPETQPQSTTTETPQETPAQETPQEPTLAQALETAKAKAEAESAKRESRRQEALVSKHGQGREPRGDRPPRAPGENRGGDRGGQGGPRRDDRRPDRGPGGGRPEGRHEGRHEGRPGGGGRPFDNFAEIELEKLMSDSLYLDNQAHAVVIRMRDMDSGTKSQLRRLYNAVRRAVRAPENERQHQFVMLRARLAYTIARHSLRSLDALERLLLQVTRKNDARGYERFKDLFEAIVAYNE
jgi:CRISPR type III-A-associated protein Csm2